MYECISFSSGDVGSCLPACLPACLPVSKPVLAGEDSKTRQEGGRGGAARRHRATFAEPPQVCNRRGGPRHLPRYKTLYWCIISIRLRLLHARGLSAEQSNVVSLLTVMSCRLEFVSFSRAERGGLCDLVVHFKCCTQTCITFLPLQQQTSATNRQTSVCSPLAVVGVVFYRIFARPRRREDQGRGEEDREAVRVRVVR